MSTNTNAEHDNSVATDHGTDKDDNNVVTHHGSDSEGNNSENEKDATEEVPHSEKTLDYFFDEETWMKIDKQISELNFEDLKELRFKSLKGCEEFYSVYAKAKGFGVRKRTPRFSRIDKHPTSCPFLCAAQGERDKKWHNMNKRKLERPITRHSCKAEIRFKWDRNQDAWFVYKFVEEHTHLMVDPKFVPFIRSHRKINEADKIYIASMYNSGIPQTSIMDNLVERAGGHDQVGCLKKDLYNFVNTIRREEVKDGDAETVMAYLEGTKELDPLFFIAFTRDGENRLEKLFWCDGISRIDFKLFGHVLVFDTTYRCNAYKKPFVVLVGVNHHGSTIPFGCALLSDEKKESFIWVLEQMLEAGGGQKPITVLTDGDKAMANAINHVLPEAKHRLCLWHLMNNVKSNGGNEFANGFMKCVDKYRRIDDFESAWKDLIQHHKLHDKQWAQDLYDDRKKWAEAYLRGHFFGGMRSTQRCESMHKTLKKLMDQKIMLYRLVQLCDSAIRGLRFTEGHNDYTTFYTEVHVKGVLQKIKEHAATIYTRNCFRKVCKEMDHESKFVVKEEVSHNNGREEVIYYWLDEVDEENKQYLVIRRNQAETMHCCCLKFESVGFPCRHMFAVMKFAKMREIPPSCILSRWTMNAKHEDSCAIPSEQMQGDNIPTILARFACLEQDSRRLNKRAARTFNTYNQMRDFYAKSFLDVAEKVPDAADQPPVGKVKKPIGIKDPAVIVGRGQAKKSKRRCSKCHKVGHTKRTCTVQNNNIVDDSIFSDGFSDTESHKSTQSSNSNDTRNSEPVDLVYGKYIPNIYVDGDILKELQDLCLEDFEKYPMRFDWDPSEDHI